MKASIICFLSLLFSCNAYSHYNLNVYYTGKKESLHTLEITERNEKIVAPDTYPLKIMQTITFYSLDGDDGSATIKIGSDDQHYCSFLLVRTTNHNMEYFSKSITQEKETCQFKKIHSSRGQLTIND